MAVCLQLTYSVQSSNFLKKEESAGVVEVSLDSFWQGDLSTMTFDVIFTVPNSVVVPLL